LARFGIEKSRVEKEKISKKRKLEEHASRTAEGDYITVYHGHIYLSD